MVFKRFLFHNSNILRNVNLSMLTYFAPMSFDDIFKWKFIKQKLGVNRKINKQMWNTINLFVYKRMNELFNNLSLS